MATYREYYPPPKYTSRSRGGIKDAKWLSPYSWTRGAGSFTDGELECMARGGAPEACTATLGTYYPSRYVQKAAKQRLSVRKRQGYAYADVSLERTPRLTTVNLGRRKKHGRQYE